MNRTSILKRAVILILGTAMLSSLGSATILCGSAPTAVQTIISGGGCLFGSATFTNFSLTGSSTAGGASADAIDPTKVMIAFTHPAPATPDLLNVIITDSNAASWVLTGTMQFTLNLSYTVGGGNYWAVGDSFNGSGTTVVTPSPGTGSVSFDKTAGPTTIPTLSLAMMSQGQTTFAGAPLNSFNVTDNIQVHATNASATLLNATNSFTVPEPMTSMMLGSGLLAFGLLLRRRKSS